MSDFQNVRDGKPFPPLSSRLLAEVTAGVPAGEFDGLKVDALKAKIDDLNAVRPDDEQIVPASTKKADLVAALETAKNSAAETAAASTTTPGESAATSQGESA